MMNMGDRSRAALPGIVFDAMHERCPYYPGLAAAVHAEVLAVPVSEAMFAGLVSHPTGVAQTESKRRISRDRSRQKRGPPSAFYL